MKFLHMLIINSSSCITLIKYIASKSKLQKWKVQHLRFSYQTELCVRYLEVCLLKYCPTYIIWILLPLLIKQSYCATYHFLLPLVSRFLVISINCDILLINIISTNSLGRCSCLLPPLATYKNYKVSVSAAIAMSKACNYGGNSNFF